ncbi:MAG TPA: DUF5343 domain-containing protein [Candidatus Hydrogenedentes bacterium]|nr:DUF5343 domain-containing protein [Candidatus Hydrogenedentota bacterium]
MALTTAYLTQTKNLEPILEAIRNAQAPEKFTSRFLVELGFDSTNDRFMVGVLRGLGFLDDSGAPTERYFSFLDGTQSDHVLADAIREAYGDLFRINSKANEMDKADVKQKLKTLTRGAKSEAVLTKMAMTFASLCKLANFKAASVAQKPKTTPKTAWERRGSTTEGIVDAVRGRGPTGQSKEGLRPCLQYPRRAAVHPRPSGL